MGLIMHWLGKPGAMKALKTARNLLADVTPLKTNCGRLCGGACCEADETGENGMLLFPYEETFYTNRIEGFAFHLENDNTLMKNGKRLVCEGTCPREHRPLSCRLFPLRIAMATDETGAFTRARAEIDPRAWAVCPLPEEGGLRALNPEFIKAVEAAGDVLLQNVYMLEALHNEQRFLDEMRKL